MMIVNGEKSVLSRGFYKRIEEKEIVYRLDPYNP